MFLGMGMPSRADEIRQYRLFFLIKYYFKDHLPSEAEVSSMFQLTQSRSKNLIRAVMTRFRYDLEDVIENTLKNAIENASWDDDHGKYAMVIQSNIILEELNRLISLVAPKYENVTKVPKSSRKYFVSEDSLRELCKKFGMTLIKF